jgi:hypothetical protein
MPLPSDTDKIFFDFHEIPGSRGTRARTCGMRGIRGESVGQPGNLGQQAEFVAK